MLGDSLTLPAPLHLHETPHCSYQVSNLFTVGEMCRLYAVVLGVLSFGHGLCHLRRHYMHYLFELCLLLQSLCAYHLQYGLSVCICTLEASYTLPAAQMCLLLSAKWKKKRKNYAFQRQFVEKPRITPGCPVSKMDFCKVAHTAIHVAISQDQHRSRR